MANKKQDIGSFEQSYKRLEEILDLLETDIEDISLDNLMKYYQEGLQLLKICRKKLSDAELKIEKINAEELS